MKATIFLCTIVGLSSLPCKSQNWFLIPGNYYSYDYNSVLTLEEDCENIWVGMKYGMMCLNTETGEKEYYNQSNSPLRFAVNDIAIDESGIKWLATSEGLYKLDGQNLMFVQLDVSDINDYDHLDLRKIYIDLNNTLWLTDNHNELYNYHPLTNKCELNPFLNEIQEELTSIGLSPGGEIYISTKSYLHELAIYKFENGFQKISELEDISLDNDDISTIFIDRSGNIWMPVEGWFSVGKDEWEVRNGGIILFDGNDWVQFDPTYFGISGEVGFMNIVEGSDGNLYAPVIESYLYPYYVNDLLKFNYSKETNSITLSESTNPETTNNLKMIDNSDRFYYINYDKIITQDGFIDTVKCYAMKGEFMVDNNDDIWSISTKVIYHYSKGNVTTQIYPYNDESELGYPLNIFVDAEFNEWVICENGVDMYDGSAFHGYTTTELGGYENENITQITQSPNGKIWILGDKHLFTLERSSWEHYEIPGDGNFTTFTIKATDSLVFIGTSDDFFVFNNGIWKSFNNTNSILSENFWCRCIETDTSGRVIFSGSNGIYEYANDNIIKLSDINVLDMIIDPVTNEIWVGDDGIFGKYITADSVIYNSENILKTDPFVHMNADSKGNIIMASQNGISIYNEHGLVGYSPEFNCPQNLKPADCEFAKTSNTADIFIYPNPVENKVNLEFTSDYYQTFSISIFDLAGRMMLNNLTISCSPGLVRNSLDITTLNPGMYSIVMTSSRQSVSAKFMKL